MQLLLRNALQIKALVKATFPDFEDSRTRCGALTADTDILSCKWNSAMREVEEYQQSGKDVEPSLLALAEVNIPASRTILTNLVLPEGPEDDERRRQQLRHPSHGHGDFS